MVIKDYPIDDIRLPKALYTRAPNDFCNPDFAYLTDSPEQLVSMVTRLCSTPATVGRDPSEKGQQDLSNNPQTGEALGSSGNILVGSIYGFSLPGRPLIQFTPTKNSKAILEKLIPLELVKQKAISEAK
ncbi:unnamed protein product [Protopolystoma xenopodis]|uniref:Uncharacterized protein n=1 Tax=Protopolystoma xenopodis TaxID=117903 RepID=A0A3S5CL13_9PLAT|nr:unnamed protein product [Protopolystoma xenopodis]